MFYLREDGVLKPTQLQLGDRIRVRPRLRLFFVWRAVRNSGGSWLERLLIRRAVRLWTPDGTGAYRQWLDLPLETGNGDTLMRIAQAYGVDNFSPPGLGWIEERNYTVIDGRFDYVAARKAI